MRVESGPCTGIRTLVRGRHATIGRDSENELRLEQDSTVSRRHATLTWEGGGWMLRDLGSKNGTSVVTPFGSKVIDSAIPVAPSDRFMVGSAIIGVHRVAREGDASAAQLRVQQHGETLQFELGGAGAVVVQGEKAHAPGLLDGLQHEVATLIARANADSGAKPDAAFLDCGRRLAAGLLPENIAHALGTATDAPLTLVLDPALLGLPWEALAPAESPLCLNRPLARQVVLANTTGGAVPRGGRPVVAIVVNPTGDLPPAQAEAEHLLHQLVHEFALHEVRFLAGSRARRAGVLEAMGLSDAVVYIGHAEHHPGQPRLSGWRLADGVFTAEGFAAAGQAPRFVLASACESARESVEAEGARLALDSAGFAAALMLAGAEQYIGAAWPIPVVSGAAFATVCFGGIVRGVGSGAAVLDARRHLRQALGSPLHACTAFVHYGGPEWTLWR